jgi:hypothetical protein
MSKASNRRSEPENTLYDEYMRIWRLAWMIAAVEADWRALGLIR